MQWDDDAMATALLFTGQGVQAVNVGLEATRWSRGARAVWEIAEAHCVREFGFSIRNIVEQNPRELTLPAHLAHDSLLICSHPDGVLQLTQFTQVALLVAGLGYWAALRERHAIRDDYWFAGHSLGEWIGLAACGAVSLPTALDLVFTRGWLMQQCTLRDASGQSPYRMAAVNPSLCGCSEAQLEAVIAASHVGCDDPAQAVYLANYNVTAQQYTCVGTHEALNALTVTLTGDAFTERTRGVQLIAGIDIPFHSPLLAHPAAEFRGYCERLLSATVNSASLAQRWIPNLTGEWIADESHVSRAHVIDLVSRQLAAPVQWIRTQEALIARAHAAPLRVIEIGPRPVLLTMFQKMLRGRSFAHSPQLLHVTRDILLPCSQVHA